MNLAAPIPFATTDFISRFSSRQERLDHVYLKDRLKGAKEYLRIAGYFRSSIFELVHEEISEIDSVRIVCNSDLDPRDIAVAQRVSAQAAEQAMIERWNREEGALDSLIERSRYERLYQILKRGNVHVRVVSRDDAPFLHGKAGIVTRPDNTSSAFIGSINETANGWKHSYEIVWEDRSPDGVGWVRNEFEHLWDLGRPLPDAVIEEIGRCARKTQVAIAKVPADSLGQAALVESPLYRRGEELMPWQRAFVSLFVKHREMHGKCRLLLADEVGVGKTLSMATSALVAALLGDGPVLIMCPATLGQQWQIELLDKLNIPAALWLSSKKVWQDPYGRIIRTRGAEDVARCPYKIGIVSTGLVVQNAEEVGHLLKSRFGMVILDEGHKARKQRALGKDPTPGKLMEFMLKIADRTRHMIIGTATPIQTEVEELWDLLEILNRSADHVLGRIGSIWRDPGLSRPIIIGEEIVTDEGRAWDLLRNPLPPRSDDPFFDGLYTDLNLKGKAVPYTDGSLVDLEDFTRNDFREAIEAGHGKLAFFQYHNPISRHVIIRRRKTLEDAGLMPKIAVDIWPNPKDPSHSRFFDGKGLRTSGEFDAAYLEVEKFTAALRKRTKGAGFMQNLLRQRICSSVASGISTCRKLIESRQIGDSDLEDEFDEVMAQARVDNEQFPGVIDDEIFHLKTALHHLESRPTDPKFDACMHFLEEKGWREEGTIVFSQYYDTARWIAESLSREIPDETIAVYGGAGKSGVFLGQEWRSVDREDIKKGVRDHKLRVVIATDAACEGLNLQTLGNLINVDLPWNPSRLEQRIGRIKRFGQKKDRVRMANLVYQGTVDERVYGKLSERMKDKYDLLGSLPDVIEDDWIESIEELEKQLSNFTRKRKDAADVFELRYGNFLDANDGDEWRLCEQVLDKDEAMKVLSEGW